MKWTLIVLWRSDLARGTERCQVLQIFIVSIKAVVEQCSDSPKSLAVQIRFSMCSVMCYKTIIRHYKYENTSLHHTATLQSQYFISLMVLPALSVELLQDLALDDIITCQSVCVQ